MKIIQTLWTKPGLNGHWIDPVFHYLSWALSCLQLRQFYPQVELYTDDLGFQLLLEEFKLPYTKVNLTLNEFPFPTYLWSAPKLKTYGLQEEPFLHIDGDVFLFKAIAEDFVNDHDIVFQNLEIDQDKTSGFYVDILKAVFAIREKNTFNDWLGRIPLNNVRAFNAGIMGGSNISFFKNYTDAAFSFLINQGQVITQLEQPQYATHLAEQVLPALLAQEQSLKTAALFAPDFNPGFVFGSDDVDMMDHEKLSKTELPLRYMNFDEFGISPNGRKYIHIIGNRKKSMIICKQIARRMMKTYPDYYNRIIDFSNRHQQLKRSSTDNRSLEKNGGAVFGFKEKLKQLKIRNVFPRTCRILLYYGICPELDSNDLVSFELSTLKATVMLDEEQKEKIKDALLLERTKFEYSASLSDGDLDIMDQRSCATLELLHDIDQVSNELIFLQMNSFTKIVTTQWNWLDTQPFLKKNYPKERKIVALLPDKITYSFVELTLTPFQRDILENFTSCKSIADGFDQFNARPHAKQIAHFKDEFFNNVVYLLSNGMLFGHHIENDHRVEIRSAGLIL